MRASAVPRLPFDWPRALKDAGMVAGIVVLLTIALLGARIQDTSGGPPLAYRFDDVIAAALIAFLGRLGIAALRAQRALPVLAGALVFAIALTGILAFGVDQQLLPFKSTVLNAISGLRPPSAGQVVFKGEPITSNVGVRSVVMLSVWLMPVSLPD